MLKEKKLECINGVLSFFVRGRLKKNPVNAYFIRNE
jgi:hypothetical protein